jgi:hypothetical protein
MPKTQIVSRLTSPGNFEKPDCDQQNYRPDDGVNDLCDDAADENKAGQWQKPTFARTTLPTTMLNSKTVTLDE